MTTENAALTAWQQQQATLANSIAALVASNIPESVIAPLRQQLLALTQQIESAGGAVIMGQVNMQGGTFIGRDQHQHQQVAGDLVQGNKTEITLNPDPTSPTQLLTMYYRALAADACRMPLGAIDETYVQTSGEQGPALSDIYVDLDLVAPVPQDEESEQRWAIRLARAEGEERLPLLATLAQPAHRYTVLLGDAGSGKSTCVNYLAWLLSTAQATAAAAATPESWQGKVVIRLILREVAAQQIAADGRRGTAQLLWGALREDLLRCLETSAADRLLLYLQERLGREGGLILLDGLDEVPQANRRRRVLLESIEALVSQLPPADTHVIVTARPYAYADKAWQLARFTTLAIAPFNETQIETFLTRWHQAVAPSLGWKEQTAQSKSRALQAALATQPYLADLATRPLLLTLMATLHSSWGQLPEDRAELYDAAVDLLLSRWQRAREVRSADGTLVVEPAITQTLGVGLHRVRQTLERLAWQAHQAQRNANTALGTTVDAADIEEGEVLKAFKPLSGEIHTDSLLGYLQDRAGLLVARREGRYAFPHRSFQEYLAACYLTAQPDAAQQLRTLALADPSWWREVVLLAIGQRKRGSYATAAELVDRLLGGAYGEVAGVDERQWRLVILAAVAAEELRIATQDAENDYYQILLKRICRWLTELISGGHLPPRERLTAGDLLGRLGDHRPGVGVIVRGGKVDLPDLVWVAIPAGEFTMGSADDDELAWADEKPLHRLTLPTFYLAQYPLTNAQFQPFIDAGGYDEQRWWTEEGWAWRQGAAADLSVIDDEKIRENYQRGLDARPVALRNQPYWWGHRQWGGANRPVVGICWFEALAYCRWLDAQLRAEQVPLQVFKQGELALPADYAVRLPTEAEWEKAARGADGRRWPWGDSWQEGAANSKETGLEETSPVGIFGAGVTPTGLHDLGGNVWEWTQSCWGRSSVRQPDYGYPYQADDGREALDGPDLRIIRGGSYYHEQRIVRGAYRLRNIPGGFDVVTGFRVVGSLASCS